MTLEVIVALVAIAEFVAIAALVAIVDEAPVHGIVRASLRASFQSAP